MKNESELTTSDVARLLDVHASTSKRWCDEGLLEFHRTTGGHRRIRLVDALALAEKKGVATWLDGFTEPALVWHVVGQAERGDFGRFVATALDTFLSRRPHELGALTTLLLTHPSVDPLQAIDRGIKALMEEVGRRWAAGELGVADEHFLSETVSDAITIAGRASRSDVRSGRTAIVGSSEPGRHDLGPLCVRFCLERLGWSIFYLGASVPVQEMASMQRDRGASLICVSFSRPARGSDVERAIRTLATSYDPSAPYGLAVGGQPVADVTLSGLPAPFTRLHGFMAVSGFERWLQEGP